jgi:hypothetical protein
MLCWRWALFSDPGEDPQRHLCRVSLDEREIVSGNVQILRVIPVRLLYRTYNIHICILVSSRILDHGTQIRRLLTAELPLPKFGLLFPSYLAYVDSSSVVKNRRYWAYHPGTFCKGIGT